MITSASHSQKRAHLSLYLCSLQQPTNLWLQNPWAEYANLLNRVADHPDAVCHLLTMYEKAPLRQSKNAFHPGLLKIFKGQVHNIWIFTMLSWKRNSNTKRLQFKLQRSFARPFLFPPWQLPGTCFHKPEDIDLLLLPCCFIWEASVHIYIHIYMKMYLLILFFEYPLVFVFMSKILSFYKRQIKFYTFDL